MSAAPEKFNQLEKNASPALAPTVDSDRERSSWDVLSLLRFFLAFVVCLTHLKKYSALGPLGWIESLGSFEAILGFLLISGYSIGHSIQKKPRGFLFRRMLRIYPVYLAAVVITFLVNRDSFTLEFVRTFLVNFFFLAQIVQPYSYVGAAWSLDLEVWLYCLASLFLRLRAGLLELLMAASFVCYAIYTCGRSVYHWHHYAATLGGINLPCLAFIWIAGFYLSVRTDNKERALRIAGTLLAGHLVVTVLIQALHQLKHRDMRGFVSGDLPGFVANALLLGLVFVIFRGVVSHWFHLGLVSRRIFHFLGDISYPLYLVHLPMFILFASYTSNCLLLLLPALGMAATIYFCCDFYSLRRKLG